MTITRKQFLAGLGSTAALFLLGAGCSEGPGHGGRDGGAPGDAQASGDALPSADGGAQQGDSAIAGAAPHSLTASNPTSTTVDLSWSYVGSGHSGFEIGQWIEGQSTQWAVVATVAATERSWRATGLPGGAKVGHRVRAVGI